MGMIGTDHSTVDVEVVRYGVLSLTFEDGLKGEVDLDGPFGSGVRARSDLAPDTLYIRVKLASGHRV